MYWHRKCSFGLTWWCHVFALVLIKSWWLYYGHSLLGNIFISGAVQLFSTWRLLWGRWLSGNQHEDMLMRWWWVKKKKKTQLFSFSVMSSRFVMSHLRDMVNIPRALPWKGAPWVRCRYATYSQVTKHQHSLQSAGLREMTEGEQVDCNSGNYSWWTERKVLQTEEFSETKTPSSI